MIVMKFGGTSNEDAVAMRNVLRIVRENLSHRPVVVISAIARATNELEQIARTASAGDEPGAQRILQSLFDSHTTIIRDLIAEGEAAGRLIGILEGFRVDILALIRGISILRELTPRSMDAICSYGERLSSRIIAAGLQEAGVEAAWVDAREFMITDDAFGRAQPLMEEVTRRLEAVVRPLLEAGVTPVTQGFIGVTRTGASTTMGRESSDYSASIIGGAMRAERVQIWTDVDGLLTADPRVVPATLKVNRVSFAEAFELSTFGAKVLHPGTMLPVLDQNIPVQILNSKRAGSTGTWVDAAGSPHADVPVVSIAARTGLGLLTVAPRRRSAPYLFRDGVFSALNRHGVSLLLTGTADERLAAALQAQDLRPALLQDLGEMGDVQVMDNLGSICVVGAHLRGAPGIPGRIFRALAGAPVHLISAGASATGIAMVVDAGSITDAVRRLHEEFFSGLQEHPGFERLPAA